MRGLLFWRHVAPSAVEERDDRPRSEDDLLLDWLRDLPEGEARRIRTDAGWTQDDVAAHVGLMGRGMVSRWESGTGGWSRVSGLRYAGLLKELEVMRDDAAAVMTERTRV